MQAVTMHERGAMAVAELPAAIRVGPFDFAVERMNPHDAASRRLWGQFSLIEQVIRVQVDIPSPIKAVDTVLHEIGHAIYWAYGIEDQDKEERIVAVFGTAWTQVWRDNPALLAWVAKWTG